MPLKSFQGVTVRRARSARLATQRLTMTGLSQAARRVARSAATRPEGLVKHARNRFSPSTERPGAAYSDCHGDITWDPARASAGRIAVRDKENEIDEARSSGGVDVGNRGRRRPGWRTTWVFGLVALTLLAGCGAPEYTYVTNSADRTYLRIPHSWRPIDERALDEAIGLDPTDTEQLNGFWLQGYDA